METPRSEPRAAGLGEEPSDGNDGIGLLDVALILAENLKLLVIGPLVAGLTALGMTYLITPTFTAKTTFLPPQQQQSAATSALASLGALSGLAGVAGGLKSPAEQYVSLLQSVSVADRLIDEFDLKAVYKSDYRFEARLELARNVRILLGRKDGLITIEVDDVSPQRAAALANRHIEELRRVTNTLALTEAQQRRVFFERQLKASRDNLGSAQKALQASGFNQAALRSEPRVAAEGYAKLKAEVTAAEVRLQTLRRGLADSTPEVQQQLALLGALREQLAKLESGLERSNDADYVGLYREYKYQEALFDLFSRQYELARLDESREGALIQVIDTALAPERKSRPKRLYIATATTVGSGLLLLLLVLGRRFTAGILADAASADKVQRLRQAFRLS